MLTPEELADRWANDVRTLANWRSLKRGPAYVKIGSSVMYRIEDVLEYEKNNTVHTSESVNKK